MAGAPPHRAARPCFLRGKGRGGGRVPGGCAWRCIRNAHAALLRATARCVAGAPKLKHACEPQERNEVTLAHSSIGMPTGVGISTRTAARHTRTRPSRALRAAAARDFAPRCASGRQGGCQWRARVGRRAGVCSRCGNAAQFIDGRSEDYKGQCNARGGGRARRAGTARTRVRPKTRDFLSTENLRAEQGHTLIR